MYLIGKVLSYMTQCHSKIIFVCVHHKSTKMKTKALCVFVNCKDWPYWLICEIQYCAYMVQAVLTGL